MAAIDFPQNPGSLTPPNYFTATSGVQYRWDGGKWVSTGGSKTYIGMGGTGSNFVTGDIKFADTVKMEFGAAEDLAIYHDGTNNYIDYDTGNLYFSINGTTKVTIDSSGDAVFTGAVSATGDLKSNTSGNGVIVTSPNGNEWRIAVDNSGNISVAAA